MIIWLWFKAWNIIWNVDNNKIEFVLKFKIICFYVWVELIENMYFYQIWCGINDQDIKKKGFNQLLINVC